MPFPAEEKPNARQEIAFPNEKKRNALRKMPFPAEEKAKCSPGNRISQREKAKCTEEMPFPAEEKPNAREKSHFPARKSEILAKIRGDTGPGSETGKPCPTNQSVARFQLNPLRSDPNTADPSSPQTPPGFKLPAGSSSRPHRSRIRFCKEAPRKINATSVRCSLPVSYFLTATTGIHNFAYTKLYPFPAFGLPAVN